MAVVALAGSLPAQATGMPTFNAPYRAFTRSEIGLIVSLPDGGGTAFEGAYRLASGRFDVGFRGGVFDQDAPNADAALLIGVEARRRVITHSLDFPFDGAIVFGAGGHFVSGNSLLIIPIGLSLGRRVDFQGSTLRMVPYIQPTGFIVGNDGSEFNFALGLGADFRFSPGFEGRLSAGLGDLEGVSIGFVWVH